ncbi:helix-turn-helix domain-containing protein [Dokdonia sp. Hel_I_53]|uniref:helix-turn-helix domain-containing protein n=1 Tax=Dokdonia sp. Hel_I_53 TaxID=1566287 RepID=UPI00119C0F09|nr:helix-turn-helix domain-containing protein [Dokdonia sp. Hel_I_53]TVZ52540.1 helix-turn-helix protein [Dokdonia sp. Hel_I_53]
MISLRIILPILFFGLIAIKSVAQQDTLATKSYDELKSLIITNFGKNDSLALEASLSYSHKARRDRDIEKQQFGYEVQARIYEKFKNEKEFTKAIQQAITLILDNNLVDQEERIYARAAGGYFSLTNWSKSLEYYNMLKEIAVNNNDAFGESAILSTIAFINTRAGDIQRGLALNKQALAKSQNVLAETDSLRTLKNSVLVSNHYTLTSAYLTLEKPDSALYHIDQALIMSSIADSCIVKFLYFMQADGYIGNNKFKDALQSLDKADSVCKIDSKHVHLQENGYRGEIALNQKKYRASVNYFLKAFRKYDVPKEQEGLMGDLYKLTAKAYKGLGNLDSANFYLEKYINTSSELDRMKSDIYSVSKRQDAVSFQKELKLLSKQKARKENLLMYGSIAGGVIIILLIVGLVKTNQRRKENEIKFKTLLDKVDNAKAPKDIIDTKDEVLEEQTSSDMNPETTQQILDGLKKLERQNYFLHPACSAHNVAKRIKTNTTYLSKVINAEFGKNFSTYINDLRINHAIVRLKQDPKFRSYTISSIATELGYKSADSFTKYFKKDTGLLPSFYIKKLNEAA